MSRILRTSLAAVGATALLVSCGSAGAPGGSVTPVGVPTSTTTVSGPAASDAPSTPVAPRDQPGEQPMPTAPAPSAFIDRADAVAEAVRRTGLPEPPAEPVLLSGWALDEGFETSEQKISWSYGQVEFGPGVDADQVGTGTMRRPDGSSRPVDVVGARDSLDRALSGALERPAPCDDIPADKCGLTVTKVVLAEAEVTTHQGQATVPVWRLTIDGLSRRISVVAVADGVLSTPRPPDPPAGLPPAPQRLGGPDSLHAVSGSSITVTIGTGACAVDERAHAVEYDDLVVVGSTYQDPPAGTMCAAIYLSRPATLTLGRPLGDRVVISARTGTPVWLGLPVR